MALLVGALVVVPVGAIVAIPAIRLSGLFLALATFGFGVLVEQLFYSRGFMFTAVAERSGDAAPVVRPVGQAVLLRRPGLRGRWSV